MSSLNESAVGVSGRDQYRALAARRIVILFGLFIALCFSMAADMALGPARYTLSDVLRWETSCVWSSGTSACRSR